MSSLTEFEQRIVRNVEEYGCQVNHVFDPDQMDPDFSYSIGFPQTIGQADVIIFGLDRKLMHSMINNLLDDCRGGLILGDRVAIDGLIAGHQCVARKALPENTTDEYFGSAVWFEKHRNVSAQFNAFQIIWPGSAQGLFPWDEGCDQDVIDSQPPLYEQTS